MKKFKKMGERKKYIVVWLLGILIVVFLAINIMNTIRMNKQITEAEKNKITETSNEVMMYMEYVENADSKEKDKYIVYALKYTEEELSVKEIKEIIEKIFEQQITEEEILQIGITQYMLEENVTYDMETSKYKIEKTKKSNADIAAEEVIKYEIKDIQKNNKDTYEVTYEKYVIENPYEILNYRIEQNEDIEEISKYLKGELEVSKIKKYITKEIGKKEKEIKVIYKLKKDNLVVSSIENMQ